MRRISTALTSVGLAAGALVAGVGVAATPANATEYHRSFYYDGHGGVNVTTEARGRYSLRIGWYLEDYHTDPNKNISLQLRTKLTSNKGWIKYGGTKNITYTSDWTTGSTYYYFGAFADKYAKAQVQARLCTKYSCTAYQTLPGRSI